MTLQELEERLMRLEELIASMNTRPAVYNITIEKLEVSDPVLENLTFKLESLDVDELSGSLNLGNNFVVRSMKNKQEKKEQNKKAGKSKKSKKEKKIEVKVDEAKIHGEAEQEIKIETENDEAKIKIDKDIKVELWEDESGGGKRGKKKAGKHHNEGDSRENQQHKNIVENNEEDKGHLST